MTRTCFLPCPQNGCSDPLPVKIAMGKDSVRATYFRVTDHPNHHTICGWRDDLFPFPELPQHELYASFAMGEEV